MTAARRALAFPFYLTAFILHLLTALFTIFAQKIAGDTAPPSRHEKWAVVAVCTVALAAIPTWVASRPTPAIDYIRLAPRPPMDFSGVAVNYPEAQLPGIKSLIRLSACIYAERALRQWLEPATAISFAPCADGGENATTLADNLIDAQVSGTAMVGNIKRPFVVALQHNPISTDDDGFITRDIKIEQADTQVVCAAAQ